MPHDPVGTLGERPLALVVDRDASVRALVQEALEDVSVTTLGAANGGEAVEMLRAQPVRLLMLDPNTPRAAGLDLLSYGLQLRPAPLVILLTAADSDIDAATVIERGVYDLLVKPFGREAVRLLAGRAIRSLELLDELRDLRRELQSREGYDRLVGRGATMEQLRAELNRLADADNPVWFHGSPGTGKKLAARTLHAASARRSRPFVVVQCASILEGEWDDSPGSADAHEGLEDLSDDLQERLLQALDSGSLADVRLMAASASEPGRAIEQGRIRPELVRQLAGTSLALPALAQRSEDIALLARHFISTITEINHLQPIRISPNALHMLECYHWPGNVQELRNAVEHAVILAVDGAIRSRDLPDAIREAETDSGAVVGTSRLSTRRFREAKREVVEAFEQAYLSDLLERHRGNVTSASQQAGMLRSALQRLLRKYGLKSAEFRKTRSTPSLRDEQAKTGVE